MKTNINTENYGAYWIDYLDGNLNSAQEEALFDFLETNPDLAGDLIDPEDFVLPVVETKYPGKSELKSNAQIDNLLIAKLENEISDENNIFITEQINSNQEVAQSYSTYKKTILVADSTVVFPDKDSLKKTVRVPMFRYVSSIAAAIAIVFVAGYFLTRNADVDPSGTKPLTSGLKFNFPRVIDTVKDLNFDNNIVEHNNTIEYTANNITNNDAQNNIPQESIEVPERLPIKDPNTIAAQHSFTTAEIMEYRYDIPQNMNDGYAYNMQYQPSQNENKFVAGIKKIVSFGKEVNVKETWDGIKMAKEELFYTSIDK